MSSSRDPMDEDLVLERDQICNAINDAFNTWDIPCTEHDSDDEEHDSIDDDHDVVDAENSTPDFFEDPNADAENDILVLDFGHDIVFAEELGTPEFVPLQTMAFNEDTTKLHWLADTALGAETQEEQQRRPSTESPRAPFPINTTLPFEQPGPSGGFTPINPSPRPHHLLRQLPHQLPHQIPLQPPRQLPHQLPRRPPHQLPHRLPRQFPHPPPHQITRPLHQPLLAPAPAPPPITNRGQRVKKPQKSKHHRTNGFNRETGEGMLTSACGITTPEKKPPVPGGGGTGNFRCPRCNGLFTRSRTVKDHFVSCTRKYGNPQGLRWFDDESLAASRKWYLDHPPTARGEMDTEGGEEANGEEEDEEGDGDLEGMDEDQSRGLYTSAQESAPRDHRPARIRTPPLSLRQGPYIYNRDSRPEPVRYPTLGLGYGTQVYASPYDPIVPRVPTNNYPVRPDESGGYGDEDEAPTVVRKNRRTRRTD